MNQKELKMKLYGVKFIKKEERYMTVAFASDVNVEDCEHEALVEDLVENEKLYDYSDHNCEWTDLGEIHDMGVYGLPDAVIFADGTILRRDQFESRLKTIQVVI